MTARRSLLAVASIVALAACQQADVGQPCSIRLGGGSAPSPSQLWTGDPPCSSPPCSGEYVEFNNVECENLVCITSPVAPGATYSSGDYLNAGYCSKPCVSDRDCYKSDTKLVCRNVVLDQEFLMSLDTATRDRYLGDVSYSNYCGVPLTR